MTYAKSAPCTVYDKVDFFRFSHRVTCSLPLWAVQPLELKELMHFFLGQWPPGHYCILANGACPAGFTRSQGHLRALSQFAASASYITPAKFGDSRIQCHGRCGQYGQWIGDLYMAACCK